MRGVELAIRAGRSRTLNLPIWNRLLYQLSYSPARRCLKREGLRRSNRRPPPVRGKRAGMPSRIT